MVVDMLLSLNQTSLMHFFKFVSANWCWFSVLEYFCKIRLLVFVAGFEVFCVLSHLTPFQDQAYLTHAFDVLKFSRTCLASSFKCVESCILEVREVNLYDAVVLCFAFVEFMELVVF